MPGDEQSTPRRTSAIVASHPRCQPLFDLYTSAADTGASSWLQIEEPFLEAMSRLDTLLAATDGQEISDAERTELSADVQNGKGDFFNDLVALLLENCAEIATSTRGVAFPG